MSISIHDNLHSCQGAIAPMESVILHSTSMQQVHRHYFSVTWTFHAFELTKEDN